jgi:UDP-glucose 4-epimerase
MGGNTVLVTGGFGFLGRAVARKFKESGFRVVGVGRGHWAPEESLARGFDVWLNAGVTLPGLMTIKEPFDVIVHCAGNGSVGYSLTNPLQDFSKTVGSTVDLLEYVRLSATAPLIVYPSSAGVYGAVEDRPIREIDRLNPISPYGYHKRIVEELLESYSRTYGINVGIIRFFSIYGPGLTKQLLWDASAKLRGSATVPATFWGTGSETRDWIYIEDAADLVLARSRHPERYSVINGASGVRTTVGETLAQLSQALGAKVSYKFSGMVREGDPRFYHADISRAAQLGWSPRTPLARGIASYVQWLLNHGSAT